MNKKQKRTLTLLFAILILLVAAIFAVVAGKARQADQAADQTQETAVGGILPAQQVYSALFYHNGNATLSFSLDENGKWFWADDPEFPLDDTVVTAILGQLVALKPQQTITEGDTLEAYGLDDPIATLSATPIEGGDPLTLDFGNTTTDGTSYYMLMNGEPSPVYIVADTLMQAMSTPIFDMCRLPTLPPLTEQTMELITLKGADAATTVLRADKSGAEEDGIIWKSGGTDVTTQADTATLLAEITALSLAKCVDFKPSAEAVAICGLNAPTATLSVLYQTEGGMDETLTLTIGAQTLTGEGYYARLSGDDTIYQVALDSVDVLLGVADSGL